MSGRTMKVGELARRTGLTVRALHHYDQIGLLAPAGRTPSGHRVYGMAEVRRLQQIASLRRLGLSLEDIGACLERPDFSLERILDLHIRRIREEMGRQERLVELLEGVRRRLEGGDDVTVDDITATIQGTTDYGRYYTPEQRAALARRAEDLGTEGLRRAERDWKELFRALGEAMAEGADPGSSRVQALARQAASLVEAFTGGDPGVRASLERMYREEGGPARMARHGMDVGAGLWRYYGEAMAALRTAGEQGR